MKRVISFIIFALISANSFSETDIENRFNKYISAFVGQDTEAFKSFISPNFITMKSTSGDIETKEEWFSIIETRNEEFKKGHGFTAITINEKTISENGNTAEIKGVYTCKMEYLENNISKAHEVKINFKQTWERINNVWYLTSIDHTRVQEPNKSLKDAP